MALQMKHKILQESRFLTLNLRGTRQVLRTGWDAVPEARAAARDLAGLERFSGASKAQLPP